MKMPWLTPRAAARMQKSLLPARTLKFLRSPRREPGSLLAARALSRAEREGWGARPWGAGGECEAPGIPFYN